MPRTPIGYKHPVMGKESGVEPDPLGVYAGDPENEWYVPLEQLPGWGRFKENKREALRITPLCNSQWEISRRVGRPPRWMQMQLYRFPVFRQAYDIRNRIKATFIAEYFLKETTVQARLDIARMLAKGKASDRLRLDVAKWLIEREDKMKRAVRKGDEGLNERDLKFEDMLDFETDSE